MNKGSLLLLYCVDFNESILNLFYCAIHYSIVHTVKHSSRLVGQKVT